jgi:mannose-6-phosphate isomerase-like protein (cupin superfamily)
MHVLENASLPQSALPGIRHTTLAGADNGLARLSVWRQTIAAGEATPPHRHDCEEVVVILSGHGELHVAGSVHRFGPDTTLVLQPDVDHQIVNTGTEPLTSIAVFSATPVRVVFPDGQPIELPWRS